ncbi:MAG: methyltransferase domain-containing protein [Proteobacteria bacterium]|nr:methyltransferase domain-containing protein [Pseudomonadota bacterium]
MLIRLAHRIVAVPWIYDLVQTLAGTHSVDRRIASAARLCARRIVVDIGGGTGHRGQLFAGSGLYLCLDVDAQKLGGWRARGRPGQAMLADATRCPFASGTVDLVLLTAVAHHLTTDQLARALTEIARVLGPKGRLLLAEPTWVAWYPVGRLLWRFDRGAHPRSAETLRALLRRDFELVHEQRWTPLHRVVFYVARPRPPAPSA